MLIQELLYHLPSLINVEDRGWKTYESFSGLFGVFGLWSYILGTSQLPFKSISTPTMSSNSVRKLTFFVYLDHKLSRVLNAALISHDYLRAMMILVEDRPVNKTPKTLHYFLSFNECTNSDFCCTSASWSAGTGWKGRACIGCWEGFSIPLNYISFPPCGSSRWCNNGKRHAPYLRKYEGVNNILATGYRRKLAEPPSHPTNFIEDRIGA